MALRLLFGDGFREVVGTGEITLELEPARPDATNDGDPATIPSCAIAPCTISRALELAGVDVAALDGSGGELPALVILNERVLAPGERFCALVRDGDVVRFQLMLTGG